MLKTFEVFFNQKTSIFYASCSDMLFSKDVLSVVWKEPEFYSLHHFFGQSVTAWPEVIISLLQVTFLAPGTN
jgi:hypothetical protein